MWESLRTTRSLLILSEIRKGDDAAEAGAALRLSADHLRLVPDIARMIAPARQPLSGAIGHPATQPAGEHGLERGAGAVERQALQRDGFDVSGSDSAGGSAGSVLQSRIDRVKRQG